MSDATAPATGALFRLRDLLDQHDLALEPLVAVPGGDERRVSGVHAVETEQPARWLAADWVLLTTGVRLVGDAAAQRRLPVELVEAGVTALGFGLGLDFAAVPEPLLEEARRVGLPVFAVPLQTAFRDIEGFAHRALLSTELRTLQRLSSVQRYLVDALYSFEPRRTIVRRLATVLESDVLLLAADGAVEEGGGAAPDDVRAVLVDPARGPRDVAGPTWRGVLAPVAADPADPDHRWLLALHGERSTAPRVTRPVLAAAAPLLAAVGRLDGTVRTQERALRRGLLEDLVAGDGDERELAARAAACGLDLQAPTHVIAVGPPAGALGPEARGRLEDHALRTLESRGLRALVATDRDRVVALLPGDAAPDEALLREIVGPGTGAGLAVPSGPGPALAVGVGRPGSGAAAVARGAEDAHVALELAGHGERPWRAFADLGLPAVAMGQVPPERVEPQVRAVLRVLDARPGSREALRAYFAHELDVTAAAQALHLHPNSLRYRLGRLAGDLGRSLRDPDAIATLVLALEAERRAGGPAGAG